MSGIGSVNAFALAGSEAAKKERLSAKGKKKSAASVVAMGASEFDEVTTSRLLQMAKEALSGDQELRSELMQAIQVRLSDGRYEEREVLESVAEKLLLMMQGDIAH
jgi:hypothetical protein